MNTNSKSLSAIAGIIFIIITALFFVVKISALYIAAYVFALIGIAGLLFGGLHLLKNPKTYPWAAAIPMVLASYLIIDIVFSAVFVILEQTGVFILNTAIFAAIHAVILAFFAIRIIMLNAGKKEIERIEEKVKESTFDWQMLVADLKALSDKSPEVKPVLEAVKYSDPVTSPKIAEYDENIRDSVAALEKAVDAGDADKVAALCTTLQRQIKDRNNRAKQLK